MALCAVANANWESLLSPNRMAGSTFDTEPSPGIDQSTSLSEAVIDAVADAEGVEPTDLQPLYDVLDPDALDSLFQPHSHTGRSAQGQITFEYHDYEVYVNENGQVTLLG